jgi:hypothetical protein
MRDSNTDSDSDNGSELSTTTGDRSENDTEIDEFTLVYLREQGARQCPDCGVWIMLEEGCDNVMCRCGCRFCYCCGQKGTCSGGTFYNNIVEDEEERSYDWDPDCESVSPAWPLFLDDMENEEFWYEHWFVFEEMNSEEFVYYELEPLFEGGWFDEEERNRIFPLFEGDWHIDGNIEMAPHGVYLIEKSWNEAMLPWDDEDDDDDDDPERYGANFFA